MATQSSMLAWEIPWTEEPGGPRVHEVNKRVGYDLATKQQLASLLPAKDVLLYPDAIAHSMPTVKHEKPETAGQHLICYMISRIIPVLNSSIIGRKN